MSLLLNYLETLSLLISNSTIRAACSIRPNNSSGKFYWSRCCVWSPMLCETADGEHIADCTTVEAAHDRKSTRLTSSHRC